MGAAPLSLDDPAAGDFELVRELGRGSSSVVYLAHQRSLDRYVALKRLLQAWSGDDAGRERLKREAQVIARLDDPRIVRLYDLITDDVDLIVVLEYVRGPSLRALVSNHPPSPGQALAVILNVAAALDHAASLAVIHRDVKPANVFVTEAGGCKLGDFGLAHVGGEAGLFLSNDGVARGTPLYMAPEQLRGEVLTPACDVYALSLMALELLSGRQPFAGLSGHGIIEAHLAGGAARAAASAPLPKPVARALAKGLATSASARPTAAELAAHLLDAAPSQWTADGGSDSPVPMTRWEEDRPDHERVGRAGESTWVGSTVETPPQGRDEWRGGDAARPPSLATARSAGRRPIRAAVWLPAAFCAGFVIVTVLLLLSHF